MKTGKVSGSLLFAILLISYEMAFGLMERDDQFNNLNLYGKALAMDTVLQCSDAVHKNELISLFSEMDSDQELFSYVKDKNWSFFKEEFVFLFHSFPFGMKSLLSSEIVSRLESEGFNLLKLIVCPDKNVDDSDLDIRLSCFFSVVKDFYNNDINTPVAVNGEKQGTVVDCLDYIIPNVKSDSYRTRLEYLRNVLLEYGVERNREQSSD
jgi:hypothetical protein